jgi:hypothetical protein
MRKVLSDKIHWSFNKLYGNEKKFGHLRKGKYRKGKKKLKYSIKLRRKLKLE